MSKPIQIELTSRDRVCWNPLWRGCAILDTLPELVDIDDSAALPSISGASMSTGRPFTARMFLRGYIAVR